MRRVVRPIRDSDMTGIYRSVNVQPLFSTNADTVQGTSNVMLILLVNHCLQLPGIKYTVAHVLQLVSLTEIGGNKSELHQAIGMKSMK